MGRKLIITVWLLAIACSIGYILWDQEVKYVLPTPIPENYEGSPLLSTINLPAGLNSLSEEKPVFLHFFNPHCPCSRFNTKHFNFLVNTYGKRVHFAVVIPEGVDPVAARDLLEEGLNIMVDKGDSIADLCGVYATPQAVILDKDSKLHYRGNYNKTRYCTQKESNYAELALNDLLNGKAPAEYGLFSSRAYGCEFGDFSPLKFFNF